MDRSIFTILIVMLVSTMAFADGNYKKPTLKRHFGEVVVKQPYNKVQKSRVIVVKKPYQAVRNKTIYRTPVVKAHVSTLQFSGFNKIQQKQIALFFARKAAWGSASISRNYFTGSLTVQIRSTWNQARILQSLQNALALQGIRANINHAQGYKTSFVPAQLSCY